MRRTALVLGVVVLTAGCQGKAKGKGKDQPANRDAAPAAAAKPNAGGARNPQRPPQIQPPLPVTSPPPDAETITGVEGGPTAVIHIKRLTPGTGPHPQRNDTVSLNFTGWRTSGETFVTTTVRKRPVQQSLARLAPGFAAAVVSMKKGERAMMWIPPELGYMGTPEAAPETTIYEVELVDIEAGPPTPPNVGAPPANAPRTASGAPYEQVSRGTGKEKPRFHDLVTIRYSAWTASGRLVDSTVVTKQPEQTFVFRKPPAIEEVLRTMVVGEVVRVWVPEPQIDVMPPLASGTLTYEIELLAVRAMTPPPPVPRDVAGPPADAKKTARGVFYKQLKPGAGTATPAPKDRVRVHYTGWTTDGRLFDSSVVRGEAAVMALDRSLVGLADGLGTMTIGSKARLWVPVELAYENAPGAPKGMLVFDVDLLDILPPAPSPATKTP